MARNQLRLDSPGILEMLQSSDVALVIAEAAESVASGVRETAHGGETIPVVVDEYTTDRAAAGVTMAHAAGIGMEAKHGSLSRAAEGAGLEVHGESPDDLIDYTTAAGKKRKATRAQVGNWTRGKK